MAAPIVFPNLGSGMEEGLLLYWTKQVGDTIKDGDVIAEIETDKTTVEVPVAASGVIVQLIGEPGQTLKVGAVIGYVEAGAAGTSPAAEAPAAAANGSAPAAPAPVADEDGNLPDGVKASPVARKMASERKIDLKTVAGTGPGGRITKSDIESYAPGAAPVASAAPAAPVALPPAPAATPIADRKSTRLNSSH